MASVDQTNTISKERLFEKEFLKSIFEGNAAGIFVVDENRDIIMVNPRFCEIIGYTKQELLGQNASFAHISQEAYERFKEYFLRAKNEGLSKIEYLVRKKNTNGIWVEMHGSPIELEENRHGVIWSIIDISERKEAEDIIKNLAFYDPLTRLPNRRLFEDRLSLVIEAKKRSQNYSALIFLDLDNFKILNDSYGHQIGDLFLKEVAQRLTTSIRSSDSVARLGGDEFVIILSDLSIERQEATEQLLKIATTLLEKIKKPYSLNIKNKKEEKTISHTSGASIGLNLFNDHSSSIHTLLHEADAAMYKAKKSGKNRIEFYTS